MSDTDEFFDSEWFNNGRAAFLKIMARAFSECNAAAAGVVPIQMLTDDEQATYGLTDEERAESDKHELARDPEAEYALACERWSAWRVLADLFQVQTPEPYDVVGWFGSPDERLLREIFSKESTRG
jgi:hypothetical protein